MTAFLIALVVFGIACLVSKINKENEFQEKRRLEKTDVALENKIKQEVRTQVLDDLKEYEINNPIALYDALLQYAHNQNLDNVDYSDNNDVRQHKRTMFADSAVNTENVKRRSYWQLHGIWSEYDLLKMRSDKLTSDQQSYINYLLSYSKEMVAHGYLHSDDSQHLTEYDASQVGNILLGCPEYSLPLPAATSEAEHKFWLFRVPPIPRDNPITITEMLDDSSDPYGYARELRILFDRIVRQITRQRLQANGIYAMSPDGIHESWYQELQKDTKTMEHKRAALIVSLNGSHKLWNEIKARNLATNHELGQIVSKYTVNNNPSLWAMDNLLSPKETISGLTLDQKLEVCSNFQKELQEILHRGSTS